MWLLTEKTFYRVSLRMGEGGEGEARKGRLGKSHCSCIAELVT